MNSYINVYEQCTRCFHFQVCATAMKLQLFIKEKVCGEENPKCECYIPTADVVDVVRCKDCKFWGIPHANDIEKAHYCCRDNMWCMPSRFAEDYCSYGERKENERT